MRKTFECFGLVLHGYSKEEALVHLEQGMKSGPQMVVTANPEILLYAKKHPDYWQVLRQADFRFVDGFGLKLIGWLFGARPSRLTGVELSEAILALAETNKWKVACIGGADGVADKAAWEIRRRFPSIQIFAEQGGEVGLNGSDDDAGADARFRLTQEAPQILLVAFGHPKQEAWIARYLSDLPSVKLAIGVGGTFDFWSGTKKRAPKFFQTLGLEWLWRLFLEPKRWKRILRAVFVFPPVAIYTKLFNH
jgi:N-acetylglucosaminyldiphosphoundecaprenol N-acetyl-beta-D-mannosaminyltransferase